MTSKREIRQYYRQLRKQLSSQAVNDGSRMIAQQLAHWLDGRPDLEHFHLFFPIAKLTEVNTFYIKDLLESQGKILYTSQVTKEGGQLDTLRLPSGATFFIDEWGIPVPQESLRIAPTKVQVVLVPLLAYDKKGNRLGFGKGYYDTFLGSLPPSVIKIGLSFFSPEEVLPVEPHDIPLNYCISPKQIWAFTS